MSTLSRRSKRRHGVGRAAEDSQLRFALDRVKAIAPQHAEWQDKDPELIAPMMRWRYQRPMLRERLDIAG